MAVFGQGINPALGRIDYTPYLQGASQGAAGIAQGIAALGQGAAQGIQQYIQKQEEKKQNEAASSMITRILDTNPGFAKQLGIPVGGDGKFDPGAIKAAIKGAGGPVNAIKLATTLEELQVQQKQRQDAQMAAQYAQLTDDFGRPLSPVSAQALSQFTPEQKALGARMKLQQTQAIAESKKTIAEAQALTAKATAQGPSGTFASVEEAANYRDYLISKGLVQKGTVLTPKFEGGRYVLEASQLPAALAPTPAEAERIELAKALAGKKAALFEAAINAVPAHESTLANIGAARAAYAEGARSGAGIEALNLAKGYINTFLGSQMFDLKNQEVLGKSFADFAVDAAARMQKQGQITENERKLLAQTVARFGNSQAGNMLVMEFMEAVAQREIAKAKYFSDLIEKDEFKLGAQVDFYKNNPIEIKSLTRKNKVIQDASDIIKGSK